MEVITETVGPFAENTYFLVEPDSNEAIVIDPGDEAPRLLDVITSRRLKVRYIINTHAHIDHVGAVVAVKEATGAPFYLHDAEKPLLDNLATQAAFFGLPAPPVPDIDGSIEAGDTFEFAGEKEAIRIIETPGHSPGSVSLHVGQLLFAGDALFQGSIGRTDLPGADHDTLLASIRNKLLVLPDNTIVYPGHGPSTTIGQERRTNPFLS